MAGLPECFLVYSIILSGVFSTVILTIQTGCWLRRQNHVSPICPHSLTVQALCWGCRLPGVASSSLPCMWFSKCLSCPNPQFNSLSIICILLKVVWQRWRWFNMEPCLSSVIRSFLSIHGKPGCLLTSNPFHPLCLKVSPAPFHLFLWVAPWSMLPPGTSS